MDPVTLRTRFDRVWAIGDVAGIPLKMGKPLPKAATFAAGEAQLVALSIASEISGGQAPGPYATWGECWLETGDGVAARGHGDFFGDPAPVVTLEPPTTDAHQAKEAWEREWVARWA